MPASFLVLTDFTPAADRALTYADGLATAVGASLVLLHVRREGLLDPDAFSGRIRHMSGGEVAAALAERTAPLRAPASVEVAVGGVAESVQQAVAQHRPALVLLGKPATDTIPDELVVSTSLGLLRATAVPLLVVPLAAPLGPPPARALLAADGQPFQLQPSVVEAANQLLTGLAATLTVTYVAEPEESDDCAAALASVEASGLSAGLPTVRTHGGRHRRASAGILQAATDTRAELILLVARRQSFLGQLFNSSVSARVVLHSPVPVLLLPASE